jgi:hypothetical protein
LLRSFDSIVEKSITEISKEDRVIQVHAHIVREKPFTIDDGSGTALVNGVCSFREGDSILVIGRVTIREGSSTPELDPIVISDMRKLDSDLFNELRNIKTHLIIYGRGGK